MRALYIGHADATHAKAFRRIHARSPAIYYAEGNHLPCRIAEPCMRVYMPTMSAMSANLGSRCIWV
jgi:hypothetical protein